MLGGASSPEPGAWCATFPTAKVCHGAVKDSSGLGNPKKKGNGCMPERKRRARKSDRPAYSSVTQDIQALFDRAARVRSRADDLDEIAETELKKRAIHLLAEKNERASEDRRVRIPSERDLRLSFVGCTGPLGACFYDYPNDRSQDHCLFCHAPRERK